MTKPLIQFTDDMIGRMFRVTGKRGRAKHFAGKVGRLVWVGPFEDWCGRGNRSLGSRPPAQSIGLDFNATGNVPGHLLVFMAASQVIEVVE